ncbi:MAG: hypothetical protein D8H97_34130 [Neisseria sp.]|nr:MAG: hypothetical protein D8H97_34130 [Neisseria sp.]
MNLYSGLNLNQYSVASPCRTICTVCGSSSCPDLNLIHYKAAEHGRHGNTARRPTLQRKPICPAIQTAWYVYIND